VASKPTIVKVGYVLVGIAFASMLAVAIIATFEGSGAFGVSHQASGRPAVFLPVVYIPFLLALIAIGAYWLIRRSSKGVTKSEASNNTPHADVLDAPASTSNNAGRAGGRER